MFLDEGSAATVAGVSGHAFVKLKLHPGAAVLAQAVPRFDGANKTRSADRTPKGEKVFPQRKSRSMKAERQDAKVILPHALYMARN